MPYKFTSKELDPETGLYYFGARYYDARMSRWISPDPILNKYLPQAPNGVQAKNYNSNLPGMGGVYNSINLNLYHYAGNSPIKFIDPDGNAYLFGYNGYYSYHADDRFELVAPAILGWVPYAGPWITYVVDRIHGRLTNTEVVRLNSGSALKIINTSSDVLANLNKLKNAGKIGKNIARGVGFLSIGINLWESANALGQPMKDVEFATERLHLLEGTDKDFLAVATPYVESRVKDLIKKGDIAIDVDYFGKVDSFVWNDKPVDQLRKDIRDMREAWNYLKSANK